MSQRDVYEWFKLYFPQFSRQVETWFPNGKNSIRVRLLNKNDLVITYNGDKDWCFETVDSYINRMEGANKNE